MCLGVGQSFSCKFSLVSSKKGQITADNFKFYDRPFPLSNAEKTGMMFVPYLQHNLDASQDEYSSPVFINGEFVPTAQTGTILTKPYVLLNDESDFDDSDILLANDEIYISGSMRESLLISGYQNNIPYRRLFNFIRYNYGSAGSLICYVNADKISLTCELTTNETRSIIPYSTGTLGTKITLTPSDGVSGLSHGFKMTDIGNNFIIVQDLTNGLPPTNVDLRVNAQGVGDGRATFGNSPTNTDFWNLGTTWFFQQAYNYAPIATSRTTAGSSSVGEATQISFNSSNYYDYQSRFSTGRFYDEDGRAGNQTGYSSGFLCYTRYGTGNFSPYLNYIIGSSFTEQTTISPYVINFSVNGGYGAANSAGQDGTLYFDFKSSLTLSQNIRNFANWFCDPTIIKIGLNESPDASWKGLYFDGGSATVKFRVWVTWNGDGDSPTIPSGYTAKEVALVTGDTQESTTTKIKNVLDDAAFDLPLIAQFSDSGDSDYKLGYVMKL